MAGQPETGDDNNRDNPSGALNNVIRIIRRLRAPDGCPWDREQSPQSISKYIKEETYELLEAIEEGDDRETCEELGDISFLLIFLAIMYEEKNAFTLADALNLAAEKMVRRHPHIFGKTRVRGTQDVLANWQKIKKQEAASKGRTHSVLGNLPKGFPALQEAFRLGERASRVGFDWEESQGVVDKVAEETGELATAIDSGKMEDVKNEFGDLLFTLANLARHLEINPEDALLRANRKFRIRFMEMEKRLEENGTSPEDADMADMEKIWNDIKGEESDRGR